jgi:outer membrane protein assembly factor BamB
VSIWYNERVAASSWTSEKLIGFAMNRTVFASTVVCVLIASQASGENWGHWRGPAGNGTADANPPTAWSESQNLKWKVPVPGRGSGSPVIWDQQVFVVTAVPVVGASNRFKFQLLCFDRETGKTLWTQTAIEATPHQETHSTNGFASASPCTDGTHVYAHFGSRGLYCYTMDGKLQWKHEFGKMDTRNSFGEGSSPTLAGNLILVPWDHEGPSSLFALDKRSGKVVWQAKRDEPTCWATPLVVDYNGRKQVVMNGERSARAYDLESGEELWKCGGQTQRPCASAVAADGLVFIGSGFRGSFLGAFRLDGKGDIEGTKSVVWTISQDTPDVASPVLLQRKVRPTFMRQCTNR